MALTKNEIKKFQDKGFTYSQTTRERASDDLVFYHLTHYDSNILEESQLSFRGQFDILKKAGRGVLADLASNPVQVDFEAIDEERSDAAETMDGLYREDTQNNTSIEAFSNAEQEMVVCGFGAWELETEYESLRSESNNQVLKRVPIYEANNTVFFSPSAKLLDKSDADWCSKLTAYTEDGYKKFVSELTGEDEEDIEPSSFSEPEQSYTFPWIVSGETTIIYVATFYHREIVKKNLFTLQPPIGQPIQMYGSELKDVIDDMISEGYEIISEKEINRWQVTKYLVSGKEILNGDMGDDDEREGEIISGEHIPIIPIYGERAIVENGEHWEGITRLAKDPQRLRNFQMSYLADIVSRSPRQKPIFNQAQIAKYEHMYELSGADNNYPYLLQNSHDEDGNLLPVGPIGVMPEQPIPSALIASIQLSRQAVEDVANPGVAQDVADVDLSGKAVLALNSRMDMQSLIFQEHRKHGRRRDGDVYASITAEIVDVPRSTTIMLPDGTRKKIKIMDQILDAETGELITLNDINNVEFQVFSKIGPDFNSQKEQTIDRMEKILITLPPGDPMHQILMLSVLKMTDGGDFDDIRDYANKQLITMGIKEPETEKEQQILIEAQNKPEPPSAEMVLAMAEDKKGQAAMMKQELDKIKMQLDYQNKNTSNEIDGFNAQTKRMDTQIDAEEANVDINMKKIESFGKELDNEVKLKELIQPINMSDEDLISELRA